MTTTQSTEPDRLGHSFWENRFAGQLAGGFVSGNVIISADGNLVLVDPTAREIELPRGSAVFEHVVQHATRGGILYLTRNGQRVAAVVPADVAESFERTEEDRDPAAGLQELLDDYEARLGPVPPEIQEEVDQQWHAAARA